MKYILVKSLIKCYFLCKIEYFHSPIYRFILTCMYVCMYRYRYYTIKVPVAYPRA